MEMKTVRFDVTQEDWDRACEERVGRWACSDCLIGTCINRTLAEGLERHGMLAAVAGSTMFHTTRDRKAARCGDTFFKDENGKMVSLDTPGVARAAEKSWLMRTTNGYKFVPFSFDMDVPAFLAPRSVMDKFQEDFNAWARGQKVPVEVTV